MTIGNLKYIVCLQVEKFKEVTDTLSNSHKKMEDRIKKVLNQQVVMNWSNIGFIFIVWLILDENVIAIPLILYAVF
jgi:hypothetical protein